MRLLILTCNTGGGHNACALAIQEAFSGKGHICEIADSLRFLSPKLSRFMAWGHTAMYRHFPGLFRWGYGMAEKHPSVLEKETQVYKLLTGGAEKLNSFLEHGGYDTVICTHVFAGMLLHRTVTEHDLSLKTAFVATDYTCSPGTAQNCLDYYFIPAKALQEEFSRQGVPEEKTVISGIPVRCAYYGSADKQQAKRKLGIDPAHQHLLMMCGSMGCGPMEELTDLLSRQPEDGFEVSVVCGSNEKLRKKLKKRCGTRGNIHIYGAVRNMDAFMDSADLFLTKPGGLSSSEALAKHLPMVLIDAVGGCEKHNLQYFVSLGGAVTAATPQALASLSMKLLKDRKRLEKMSQNLAQGLPGNADERIYEVLQAALADEPGNAASSCPIKTKAVNIIDE